MVRLAELQVVLDAPASEVWQRLTTVEGLLRWMAVEAIAEPVPGGRLQWTHENGATMIGRFLELDPPRRLVFAYGWKDDLMGVPPESTTVEIELEEHEGRTTLSLVHRGIPPEAVSDHERGWDFFIARLRSHMGTTSPQEILVERFSEPGIPPTPWSRVEAALERAELFWLSTVRSDGRPHVAPLPAVWHEGRLHFCTGADEQKAINIERNPRVALTTGNDRWKEGLDVVVEGNAVRIKDDSSLQVLADLWRSKYFGDWDYKVGNGAFIHGEGAEALVFEVSPEKVLSFAKGRFAQTRYRF